MKRAKRKNICKKHHWREGLTICPICGVRMELTLVGDTLIYEMSMYVPMKVPTTKTKSGIVLFKTLEDEK